MNNIIKYAYPHIIFYIYSVQYMKNCRYQEIISLNLTDSVESGIAEDASRLLMQFILAHRGSFTLNDVILNRDYRICPGDLRLNWNGGGYKTILDVLIGKIPNSSQQLPFDEKLQLNKEVYKIY